MKKSAIIVFIITSLIIWRFSYAQTPEITDGLNYLTSVQNQDGSWGSDTSNKAILPVTTSVIETFQALNQSDTTNYLNAVLWLQSQSLDTTEYLSERMLVLSTAAADKDKLLTYIDSLSYAWGGYDDYGVSIIDTTIALQALKTANYSNTTLLDHAVNYLATNQNADGGWGFTAGSGSSTYVTAIVSLTLQQFPQTTALATAINKATSYLLAHRNTDGGFGSSPSTVCETALTYRALSSVITDATILGGAVNYLTTVQAANGSWNEDPYSTALALQALHLAETRPVTPPPTSTTGTVNGTVVDGSTNQPLSGASVTLVSNAAIAALTDSAGSFSLANIPQGSQQITFSLSGYAASTATVTVTGGSIINLGTVPLSAASNTGIIQGTVTDASNGSPLAGVIITIAGSSTWTATTAVNGSYKITDITPGNVTLSAAKSGFSQITGVGTVVAGGTLIFSPALSTTPPTATTGELKGTVIDFSTKLPISGATVSATGVNSYAATTDVTGNFVLSAMDAGSYTVSVSSAGYGTQAYTVTLIAGTASNLGGIALLPNATTGTVQGKVTDATSGSPISGATITITGSSTWNAVTIADGSYKITGVGPGVIAVSAGMTGYSTVTGTGTVTAGGTLIFSPSLSTTPPVETTGVLKGAVADNAGQAVAGATISATGKKTYTASTGLAGEFSVSTMDVDTYSVTVTAPGYLSQSYSVTILAGVTTDMGTVNLLPAPATGTVSGMVTDNATGSAIAGVTVSARGASTWQAVTGSDGTYQISDITPGAVTLSAAKTGYGEITGTGTVTAGGTLTFSPSLLMLPTTGEVKGTVIDSSTSQAISGAIISLATGTYPAKTTTTDATGAFSVTSLSPGNYTIAITATGYAVQTSTITIVAGTTTDIGGVGLNQTLAATTVSGRVTDAITGSPIVNATVAVAGTMLLTTTSADGTYTLSDIFANNFTLRASAIGYDSLSYDISTTGYDLYAVNLSLSQSNASTLRVLSVETDLANYSINADALITASIENFGDTPVDALITALVTDADGKVLGIVGPAEPQITLASLSTTTVTMTWNTGQTAPGNYTVVVKAAEAGTAGYGNPLGNILAERSTAFAMTASSAIEGSLSLNPPVGQEGMLTPVAVTAAVRNSGNISLAPVMQLEVTLDGNPVYAHEIMVPEFPVNTVVELDFGAFTASGGGNYSIRLYPADPTIVSNITKTLYVGPNAKAAFTATPNKALIGNAKAAARIHVEGAGVSGAIQDPMVPLMKSAIQKGVYYEQASVMRWHKANNCNGCHIQAQALVGLELSKNKVVVDEYVPNTLFAAFKGWQKSDGSMGGYPCCYFNTMTHLGLWALTSWHDQNEAKPYILKAADFLLTKQNASGSWTADHASGWWGEEASTTALSIAGIAQAYRLSNDAKYMPPLTKATQYLTAAGRVAANNNMLRANQIIGLQAVVDLLQDAILKSQVQTTISSAIQTLKSAQRTDGGWGRYTTYVSDSLVSAQVLYAMIKTGTPGDDASLKKATQYLLNTQGSDGSWTSQNNILSTKLAATTWVIISLPLALERVGGIDVETHIALPANVVLSASDPAPTSQTGSDYTWQLTGVGEIGQDITLDLTVQGLALHEARPLAQQAYLSFNNTYTNELVTTNIEIPNITGVASETISVSTDKPDYGADENVAITAAITNDSAVVQNPVIQLFIEDISGNRIAQVASFIASALEPSVYPSWAYRIPASVTATKEFKNKIAGLTIDFSAILTALGFPGKTVDQNSIRVVEIDASKSLIGEKQATAIFSDPNTASVRWYVDGVTGANATRYFQIYFDTTDHGTRETSLNTNLPKTGSLIAYVDDGGNIYVAESKRDGTFGAPQLIGDITAAGDLSRGVALEDFNGDGFVDIISGSGSNGRLYYYQNKADGTNTFNSPIDIGGISTNSYVMGMASADFNNDGKEDFVVSGNNTSLILFKGNGTGTFTQTTIQAPAGTTYLRGKVATDVDGDGKIDLVVAAYGGGIFLYKGNGDGTFGSPVQIGTSGTDPYGLIAGDFNEDGKIDIIANVGSIGESNLFIGNGNGSFGSAIYIASLNTGNYGAFAVDDFNNDGHLDVLVANYTGKTITFYPGKGNGTFGTLSSIGTSTNATLGISASPALPEIRPVTGVPENVPSQSFGFVWNTGNTPSDNYQIHAVLSEAQTTVSESYASLAITPDIRAAAQVVTDKISYNPNEAVVIASTITSRSRNAVLENLTATLTISLNDSNGTSYTDTKSVKILMQGASFTFKSYWNTGTYAPGNYPVTLEVKDINGTLITAGTTTVTINNTTSPSIALRGAISVDKQSLLSGETLTTSYTVTNISNIDLSNVDLSVLVVDLKDHTVRDTLTSQATLSMGATYPGTGQFNTTNYTAKDYLVVLRASIDGIEETLAGTYFRVEGAPTAPALIAPAMGSNVDTLTPLLTVSNASDPNDDKLTYEFELYSESGLSTLLAASGLLTAGTGTTAWTAPFDLTENSTYFWRTRAYDGQLYGPWMDTASFRVNTANEPPTAPVPTSPLDGSSVSVLTPILTVTNAFDPDSIGLTYNFDIALDPDFTQIAATTKGVFEGSGTTSWQVSTNLAENSWYYWRAQADDWQIEGPWSTTVRFFINTANDAPTAPVILTPADQSSIPALATDIVAANSTDPDSSVLTYYFELDTAPTFSTANLVRSNAVPEGQQGTTVWNVANLTDNTWYYVRAKAADGQAESQWSNVNSFFVNTTNDPPTTPVLSNPSNGAGVTVSTPTLSVYNSMDLDKDVLTYEFEVYSDAALTSLVTSTSGVAETAQTTGWTVSVSLTENQTYYWRARAYDGQAHSGWMNKASFFVNTANDAPEAPILNAPGEGSTVTTLTPTLSIKNAKDPDSDTLTYDFELYSGGVLIQSFTAVPEGSSGITSLALTTPLIDNTVYQWQARAYDGDRYGAWMTMASFTVHLPQTGIKVEIEVEPETLNKKSEGKWVMVEIELPHGYRESDVDISSIRLEGTVPAEPWPHERRKHHHEHGCEKDHTDHDHGELKLKFKRSYVIAVLPTGKHVPVHVTGKVGAVTFEGVDIIKVMDSNTQSCK